MLLASFFKPALSAVFLAATLPMVVACGDDTTEVATLPLEEFPEAHREATCRRAVACTFMPDLGTCMSITGTDRGVAQAVAAVNAGTLTYDPAAAAVCVNAIRTEPCVGFTLFPQSLRDTCDKVFGNRKGEGEPCFHASECQGVDAACEGSCPDMCCQGVCRLAAGYATLGEFCVDKPCDETTYCKAEPTGNVCSPKVGAGESCENDSACVEGYACDPSTGTCFRQADPGAACNPGLASDGCAALAEYCEPSTSKCTPYPAAGEPCGMNALAPNICAAYAFCDPMTMTCTALPKEGEPCPLNACMGENLYYYGIVPTLRCSSNQTTGTCEVVPSAPACSQ